MKLHLSAFGTTNAFTGYGEGYVLVNGRRHEQSLIVLPDRLVTGWEPASLDALTAAHVGALLQLEPEIVLLGTGATQRFPRTEVLLPLVRAKVGYEIMDVQAACRTYNILADEGRKALAALLLG